MAVKLAAYAQRAGVAPPLLLHAYELAVERRLAVLRDVFHPDTLHPARTALILLEDVSCTDADVLAAGALTETEYPTLRFAATELDDRLGRRIAGLVEAVPVPAIARDALAEELVVLPNDVALMALAERLDHARHLHFREAAVWPAFHSEIREIYLPLADRVHERLAERLARWADSFERRFLS